MLTEDIKKYRAILNEADDTEKVKAQMLVKYFELYSHFRDLSDEYDNPNESEYRKYPDLNNVFKQINSMNNKVSSSFGPNVAEAFENFIEGSVWRRAGNAAMFKLAQAAGIEPNVFYSVAKDVIDLKNPDTSASTFDSSKAPYIEQAQKNYATMARALAILADPNADNATREKAAKAFKRAKSAVHSFSL